MDQSVPGFVPGGFLSDDAVGLFRADERVFEAMLDRWSAQMLARGPASRHDQGQVRRRPAIPGVLGQVPWTWQPVDIDDYMGERRSGEKPISLTTLRSDSNAVAMFCSFLTNPAYGWAEFCDRTFGDVPAQICFDWNAPKHTTDDAVPPARRSFTRSELEKLFNFLDDEVDASRAAGSKRWVTLFRDSIAFKLCYAYGLRRRELAMLDLHDFGPNPHVPRLRHVRRPNGSLGQRHRRFRSAPPHCPDGSQVRLVSRDDADVDVPLAAGIASRLPIDPLRCGPASAAIE